MLARATAIVRRARAPGAWLVAGAAVAYGLTVAPYWKPTSDSAIYISLARALAQGHGYTYMGAPHTKYPPGFPSLLAWIELFSGDHFLLMRALVAGCAVAAIGLTYCLMRRIADVWVATAVTAMTAASYALFIEITRIHSDVPYMLAALAALLAAHRYQDKPSARAAFSAAALILLAQAIRTIGLSLAATFALAAVTAARDGLNRRRLLHACAVLAAALLVTALWVGRNALLGASQPADLREGLSYWREFVLVNPNDPRSETVGLVGLLDRISLNATFYSVLLVDILSGRAVKPIVFAPILAALWLAGFAFTFVQRRGPTEYYTLLYLSTFLLWPSWEGERFLVPILPMIFYYALQPIRLLFALAVGRITVTVAGSIVLMSVALLALWPNVALDVSLIRTEHQRPYYRGQTAELLRTLEWIRDHTPPTAVVIADPASYSYLISGRRSLSFPRVGEHQRVLESLERTGATHVVATESPYTRRHLNPVIGLHPKQFRGVHREGSIAVYEFQARGAPRPPASDAFQPGADLNAPGAARDAGF